MRRPRSPLAPLSALLALTLLARGAAAQPTPAGEPQPSPAQPSPAPSPAPAADPPPAPEPPPPPPPEATPSVAAGLEAAPPPGADTPRSAAEEKAAKPRARPFAGSSLFNQNSITTGTIFRGQQLYDNPTVESNLYILPRYALSEAWQLRGRIVLSYEFTNSDTTRYRNEPLSSDTVVSLYYRALPKLAGFQPYVAASLAAPTSKLSRARTLVVTPGVLAQFSRSFAHFFHGTANVVTSVGYTHPFYRSKNPEVVDERPPGAFACVGGNNCQDLLSGTLNPSDTLSYTLLLEAEWGKWNPAVYYLGASQWVYHPSAATNPIDGTTIQAPPGFEPTSVRQTHYVSAWLDYNFNSWFTGEIGFWNAVSAINGAGERSNLFFDRYQDTRVYLGASIQLDNLVQELSGKGEGESGIVRAKNSKQPMFRF